MFFDHLKKDDKAFPSRMWLKKHYASNIDKENVKEKNLNFSGSSIYGQKSGQNLSIGVEMWVLCI